jgi:hypothetical protein
MADAQMKGTNDLPNLQDGLLRLCSATSTQSGEHIKPINAYCATRLVIEGGLPPDWVNPRPPLSSSRLNNAVHRLRHAPEAANKSETRVLGGIKYKNVDVVAVAPGLGPALGISAKSTGNAFRNLTNRMEEALGECTNVHLMYPGFVFGFLHLIKFSRESDVGNPQDASFDEKNEPLPAIKRYHEVLAALAGRSNLTDPGMRYESVGLLVYQCFEAGAKVWSKYPPPASPVHFSRFFQRLYDLYDLRFGYPDPDGPNIRKEWSSTENIPRSPFDAKLGFPWQLRMSGHSDR